ncbi:MAG: DUF6265 family protein [Candidatus Zixiibacteriota bacterium]
MSTNQTPCTLDSFHWLPGLYVMESSNGMIIETWTRTDDGSYHGTGITIKSGNRISIEKMRIELNGGRGIVFVADVPHNNAEVLFDLIEYSSDDGYRFVFENPTHDYPQRVIYQFRPDQNTLLGRIEGTINGQFKATDFPYLKRS